MAEQDIDRRYQATPHKLKQARKRGQVAKSGDVVSAMVFAIAVMYLSWQGWAQLREQFRFNQALLLLAGRAEMTPVALWDLVARSLHHCLLLLGPFFVALMLTAIVSNIMQTGPVLSSHPLGPTWGKLNPAAGFKRIFSMRTLFDTFRSCLKLVLLTSVVYLSLKSLTPQFLSLSSYSNVGYVHALLDDVALMGIRISLMMGVIALLDWLYSRREFAKNMRMSNRDIRDESKQREGDPRIRSRLRELRREMLKRSLAVNKTRQADVLITNPTHLAIALRYEHGMMQSPQLLAKGTGTIAQSMRDIAALHRIPVVQNRTLARKLYRELDFDQHVPSAMYAEVARIIVWVFAMRKLNETSRAVVSGHA
jgi:flagellar biosynthetic protein FlhB